MMTKALAATAVFISCLRAGQIPEDEAQRAFDLASSISAADAGLTWGTPVCGPIMFGDPETHEIVSNQADAGGKLRSAGKIWRGQLPPEIHIANTAIEWSGVRWTMVMWPLPNELRSRAQLLGHECYHRIQASIGLPATDSALNTHLDSMSSRIWLLLEWRALERAIVETGEPRRMAIADALLFRRYRRALIKGAEEAEDRLEMNEGLAEYTGVRLANPREADRRAAAIYNLRDGPRRASLVRSFAYVSGPAYGVLLDVSDTAWRSKLSPTGNFGDLLASANQLPLAETTEAAALRTAGGYDGAVLIKDETDRQDRLNAKLAELRKRFVAGPVLILPVSKNFNYGFNPNGLTPLSDSAVVYDSLRVSDDWGVLEAESGMMVRENGTVERVVVPAPPAGSSAKDHTLKGVGWTLTLNPNFTVTAGALAGDLTVHKDGSVAKF